MRRDRLFKIGGIVSGSTLAVFGVVVIILAIYGQHTVTTELKRQQITGTPDMTPDAIKASAAAAGLHGIDLPTCDVAGKPIDSGMRARCFAQYMNVHALEATGGFVYSQMGIYTAKADAPKSALEPGGGTNDPTYAETDPRTKQPMQNAARNVWVTETALSTALNMSYMASALSIFSLIVGIALLLSGVGFIVLALTALPRRPAGATETAEVPQPATS